MSATNFELPRTARQSELEPPPAPYAGEQKKLGSGPAFELGEDLVEVLLDKLSSDDDFRAIFVSNARHALALLGHSAAAMPEVYSDGIWVCLGVTRLAPKERISQTRDLLRRQLTAQRAAHNPISLI